MKLLLRILLFAAGAIVVFALFLAASISIDAALGRGRVSALTNTLIPGPDDEPAVDIRAYVARPDAEGPVRGGVIMIHEFWGIRESIQEKAEALAEEGYLVVAPDTYRGRSTSWLPRAIWLALTTPYERVVKDLAAVQRWLDRTLATERLLRNPPVASAGTAAETGNGSAASGETIAIDGRSIAVVGFCYGGGKALQYALTGVPLAATVIYYGSLVTDPTRLSSISSPILGIFGKEDNSIPQDEVAAFDAGLSEAGVAHEVVVYDSVGHAFVKGIDSIREGGAAGKAWDRMLTFLDRYMPASQ